jgi:hypothetical protein
MTAPARTYDVELSPVARQIGVAYLHDVDLDAGEELTEGAPVALRDEGGARWDGVVVARDEVRLGHKYRLEIEPRRSR